MHETSVRASSGDQTNSNLRSPAFVLEEALLVRNLEQIAAVRKRAGVDIILALKAFSLWHSFPLVKRYLSGATASSLWEAELIHREMGCPAHTYAVGYTDHDFDKIVERSSHLTFNSLRQFHRFADRLPDRLSVGLRVNPEYAEVETELYNPAAPGSRLGMSAETLPETLPERIDGLHFHTLCESDSFQLERTLEKVEERFGRYFPQIKWLNMGGGHLMTREGYDIEHLIGLLKNFREKHDLKIILEPGSAVAWQTGYLLTEVLDIHESAGIKTLILDVSFTAHMPDTLEMPYRPSVRGATDPQPGKPTYRLGGVSCLAGDYLGEYSFEREIRVGDRLILDDMIHYTMVKTTFFNGVRHPDIVLKKSDDSFELLRRFEYEDFRSRLG